MLLAVVARCPTGLAWRFVVLMSQADGAARQRLTAPFGDAQSFAGGLYSSSNTETFPESKSISGSLVNLTAGGLRQPHWHTPEEWGVVLGGTCRYTLQPSSPACVTEVNLLGGSCCAELMKAFQVDQSEAFP